MSTVDQSERPRRGALCWRSPCGQRSCRPAGQVQPSPCWLLSNWQSSPYWRHRPHQVWHHWWQGGSIRFPYKYFSMRIVNVVIFCFRLALPFPWLISLANRLFLWAPVKPTLISSHWMPRLWWMHLWSDDHQLFIKFILFHVKLVCWICTIQVFVVSVRERANLTVMVKQCWIKTNYAKYIPFSNSVEFLLLEIDHKK